MQQNCFRDINLYRAMTLAERWKTLHQANTRGKTLPRDVGLAHRRLQEWRTQAPFERGSYFHQRLSAEGLTEADLLYLLAESEEGLRDRQPIPPPWMSRLSRMLANGIGSGVELPLSPSSSDPFSPFLDALQPMLEPAFDRLRQGVASLLVQLPRAPFDPLTILPKLWSLVVKRLLRRVGRTLTLEMHVARLQGRLSGDTAEDRFLNFLKEYRRRDVLLRFLEEYPVLARELARTLDRSVAFELEFIGHLSKDASSLHSSFQPDAELGVLVGLEGGAGDTHRGGRSVRIVEFSSGLKVVYKPRPLGVEKHFQELLEWLNSCGADPSFRTLKVLDCIDHGWTECVVSRDCKATAEVKQFYERLGGLLSVLHALAASDFHHENVIAAGDQPVLVDLEALFHPDVHSWDLRQADHRATQELWDSVTGTLLLPNRILVGPESDGMDISGLSQADGQLTAYPVSRWLEQGTDEMRLERGRAAMTGGQNLPTLNGLAVDPLEYRESFVTGFSRSYDLLLENREELLAPSGMLMRFAGDEVCAVLRSTHCYEVLLAESFHPDVLRDALDRDCFWDCLWATVPGMPRLAHVIPSERADLENGDIPLFSTRPSSRHLWNSAGEAIPDFLEETGLERARQRLLHFCAADRARQVWFIRASFATLETDAVRSHHSSGRSARREQPAHPDELIAAARAVGDRLEALATLGDKDASWVGLVATGRGGNWALELLGKNLNDGLPGVALFLAHLGAITRQERYTALARRAVCTLRWQIEFVPERRPAIGAQHGWGGVIYSLAHLADLWQDDDLRSAAEMLLERLPPLIEQDKGLDMNSGSAGCIGALFGMNSRDISPRALDLAVLCGERLLATAQRQANGIGWVTVSESPPLTGFSHGAAGFVWALLKLAGRTGDARFRNAALEALAYERSQFVPAAKNWRDLRKKVPTAPSRWQKREYMTAWCHGTPGIGISRLLSLPYLEDDVIRGEIAAALETTLADGFGGNHSLCHGDLGNLELLLQAEAVLGERCWRTQALRLGGNILADIAERGWQCGHPSEIEIPGLMTGLAGIGYGLLRLAAPECIPAVLALAPPAARRTEFAPVRDPNLDRAGRRGRESSQPSLQFRGALS